MAGPLLLPALAIGTATQTIGGIMAAREKSAADAFQSQQFKIQQQQYETAAAQDEAKRREQLNSAIDTIMAVRAGRGVGENSPTGQAIMSDLTDRAESDIFTSKTNLLSNADSAAMSSAFAQRKSRMDLLAGDIGAISNLATGVARYNVASKGGYGLSSLGV